MNKIKKFKNNHPTIVNVVLGTVAAASIYAVAVAKTARGYQWSWARTEVANYDDSPDLFDVVITFKNGTIQNIPVSKPKE